MLVSAAAAGVSRPKTNQIVIVSLGLFIWINRRQSNPPNAQTSQSSSSPHLHVPPVDLIDDLQVSGQQVLKQVDGPALQRLRQDGVVGVGTRTDHDVPSLDARQEDTWFPSS